jgi:TRAP-type C4-dicarboxylate transport system substrate-binding protein
VQARRRHRSSAVPTRLSSVGGGATVQTMRPIGRVLALVTAASVAVVLGGCQAPAVDKNGARASSPLTTIRIGASNPGDPELAYFIDALGKTSQHRLRVDVDRVTYYTETSGGEARLAGAVRSGAVQVGYVPTRDWATTGDPALRAVQSPFLLSTTAAAVELARGPLAHQLLAGLDREGVHGLALVPGEARRLVSREPITSVADLADARIRIIDNPGTARLIAALGAVPIQGLNAGETGTALSNGTLAAVELEPTQIKQNSYNLAAPYITSFGLIPKLWILMVNGASWKRLARADRLALQEAAAQTVVHAAKAVPAAESRDLTLLCRNGAVLVAPSDAALDDFVHASAPAGPHDGPGTTMAERISTTVTGSGPRLDASPVPAGCPVAGTKSEALRQQARSRRSMASGGHFPTGTYVVTITTAQWQAGGVNGADHAVDITFTTTFKRDGTIRQVQRPDFPDQGVFSGVWSADADRLRIVYSGSSDPDNVSDEIFGWSYFKGVLTFTPVVVQDPGETVLYTHPWRKVA